jgi:hypothetical protein
MPKVPSVLSTGCVKVEFRDPTDTMEAVWIATNVNTKKRVIRPCDPNLSAPEDAAKLASELLDTKRLYSSPIDGGGWFFMGRRDKSKTNVYIIKFYGRRVGAIGIFSSCEETVEARSPEAAKLKLYNSFEHISSIEIREV